MNEKSVGRRIARLRDEFDLTQAELAERLGVTDRAVSKWETGENYPDVTLLPVIADVFGVSIDYVLRGGTRKRQRVATISPYNTGTLDPINNDYLACGWVIEDIELCGDGDGGIGGIAVLEKEIHED